MKTITIRLPDVEAAMLDEVRKRDKRFIDIQRINSQDDDYRRISSYLGKQTNLELIALDPFNSDLSPQKK